MVLLEVPSVPIDDDDGSQHGICKLHRLHRISSVVGFVDQVLSIKKQVALRPLFNLCIPGSGLSTVPWSRATVIPFAAGIVFRYCLLLPIHPEVSSCLCLVLWMWLRYDTLST